MVSGLALRMVEAVLEENVGSFSKGERIKTRLVTFRYVQLTVNISVTPLCSTEMFCVCQSMMHRFLIEELLLPLTPM